MSKMFCASVDVEYGLLNSCIALKESVQITYLFLVVFFSMFCRACRSAYFSALYMEKSSGR